MAPAVDVPANNSGSAAASRPDETLVRDMIDSLSTRAVGSYATLKEASPMLKNSMEALESRLSPLKQPVADSWKGYGEPLVSKLDNTLTNNRGVISGAVSHINESIVKPAQETTSKAFTSARQQAEQAIDRVLPKEEGEAAADTPVAYVKTVSHRACKLAERSFSSTRESSCAMYTNYKAQATALVTDQVNRTRCTAHGNVDRLVLNFPNEQSVDTLGKAVVARAPEQVRPQTTRAVEVLSPYMVQVLIVLLSLLVAFRAIVDPVAEAKLKEEVNAAPSGPAKSSESKAEKKKAKKQEKHA